MICEICGNHYEKESCEYGWIKFDTDEFIELLCVCDSCKKGAYDYLMVQKGRYAYEAHINPVSGLTWQEERELLKEDVEISRNGGM